MSDLVTLKMKSMKLYFKYRDGLISLESYIQQIRPLDYEIDQLEVQALSCHLVGNPVLQTPSSKHLH